MRITWKQLALAAEEASARCRLYNFRVNKRNGYYALDYYFKSGTYIGCLERFNGHDMFIYLRGFINGTNYSK